MERNPQRLFRWQALTVTLLVVGYAGYYLCRSNLSVTLPLIIADLAARGMDPAAAKVRLGAIASLGTLGYAVGKLFGGGLADLLGGRRNFLGGMLGAALCTALFALGGGMPAFAAAWLGNRLVQSLGWVGIVRIVGRWFSFAAYGTVLGLVSLSFLFGDALARQGMGLLIQAGVGWRAVFWVAGCTLFGLFLITALLLRESPRQVGEPEPPDSPLSLYGPEDGRPSGLRGLLRPLLRRPAFWLACLLSLGFTLMRETFNTWTPTYFTEAVGLGPAEAAAQSALFPLFGGVSVLLAGFAGDRLGRGGRAVILFWGLVATAVGLSALGLADLGGSRLWPVALVTLLGLVMIGPYSYLAGAVSLDFGGKRGGATACGLIDGVGYLGGVLAGDGMARLSVACGWAGAFAVLAGVAWLSCAVAALFWVSQRQQARAGPAVQVQEITP
jgi:OPA family glycerol-3-phosphate transporter-like MFS transporter